MVEEEREEYFCPFVKQVCHRGFVRHTEVLCRFWSTEDPQRCRILPALGGLAALIEVPGMLQSLASRGGE